ncbi:MAG: thiamine pyrophosphate-dependent dehydrogenase E1 component subunit alpha [Thermoplasmata archaeon]
MMTDAPATIPLPYEPADVARLIGPDWRDRLTRAYQWMVLARTLDARMLALQRQGRIGFYGPATGQEAVSVAAGLVSTPDDWIFPGLREQLVALMRGLEIPRYVHHLFANDLDAARGRQMPCHPTAREVHYVSMSSVIGTQIAHAVGMGYALKMRRAPGVAFAFFGDGATSSNDFHAGMNFASVFQLPVVFCCTNNQWAISMPVEHQTRVAHLAEKAKAYGMAGRRVDGTDVIAIHHHLMGAVDAARRGEGPRLLEFVLFRMTPHSSSDDPSRYQAANWMARARAKDPVDRLELWLIAHAVLDAAGKAHIARQAESAIKSAIAQAEAAAPPDPASLTTDVYALPPPGSTPERR